jgi:hypothetical protein
VKPSFSSSSKPVSSSSSKPQVSSSSSAIPQISSSAALPIQSSSSVVIVDSEWQSNTQLQENQDGSITIGQSNDYASERVITKVLGNIDAGNSYVLSFDIAMPYGNSSMDISVGFESYCNDVVTVQSGGSESYKCEFTASTSTESATLELKTEGNRWEQLILSNLTLAVSGNSGQGGSTIQPEPDQSAISVPQMASLKLSIRSRMLEISGGSASLEVFDMQGRPLKMLNHVSGVVSLESLPAGSYIVRAHNGSNVISKRVTLR